MPQTTFAGKERILAAARGLFAARGFDSVTIRDIGEAAGLTNPALYRHFADKEALGVELYRRSYDALLRAVEAAVTDGAEPLDRIEACACAMVELFEAEPDLVLYIDEHQVRFWPRIRDAFEGRNLSQQISRWVADARRSGALSRAPANALQVSLVMGTLSHWFAMRAAGLVEAAPPERVAGFVLHALTGADR